MKKRIAEENQPDLIIEVCAVDLTSLDNKVKISPVGKATGIDGRVFNIDGNQVLERLIQNKLELALNVNHGWSSNHDEAVGWFKDFELKKDGIYATLELNEAGKELVTAKKYKYLSPEFFVGDMREVNLIVGIGLVNKPNLLNKSLNNQSKTEQDMADKKGETEVNVVELQQQNNALTTENDTLKQQLADLNKQAKLTKIDNAVQAGKLIPAKKEFALSLEGNALDDFLALEAQSTSKTDSNNLQTDAQQADDTANCAISKQFNGED